MKTPQEEATQLLSQVLHDILLPNHDLKSILQRCQLACHLAGWNDWRDWFTREITGYIAGTVTPDYRKVPARLIWRGVGGIDLRLRVALRNEHSVREPDEEPTTVEFWQGIDWLVPSARSGAHFPTGDTKPDNLHGQKITVERVQFVEPGTIAGVLHLIENTTYNFAIHHYSLLQYSNALSDIWTSYRTKVDGVLSEIGLTQHLDAIQAGLRVDNPESARSAVFGCRNLLSDLANYLWQDGRETYEYLKNRENKPLRVTSQEFANRLRAYIHQKGLRGTRAGFLHDEMDRLATSIRSLVALQSEAHNPIDRSLAMSITLATYYIIGELVIRTDMQQIVQYDGPAR